MLVPESYREIEKAKGRSLREIGSAGVAFTRADILEVFKSLKGTQVGVLGGDVLRIVGQKLRYTNDNWHVKKKPGENIADYLARSVAESERYVLGYRETDATILYAPVISELGIANSVPTKV